MALTVDISRMSLADKLELMEQLWRDLSSQHEDLAAKFSNQAPAGKASAAEEVNWADSPEVQRSTKVDWSLSPAVTRDRSQEPMLSGEQVLELIHDSSGRW